MKKYLSIIIGLICLCGINFASADQGGYTIDKYDVDMQVNSNGSMHVTETITANFSEYRHGIYRDIPLSSNGHSIVVENLTAFDDPIASTSVVDRNYQLKIGDADKTIIGSHRYVIGYDVRNAISSQSFSGENREELYRNVIGTKRNTTIKNISFKITLPKDIIFGSGESFVVYGPQGATQKQGATIQQISPTTIIGSLSYQILNPYEGLTIGLKFNSGYFSFPSNYESFAQQDQPASVQESSQVSVNSLSFEDILDMVLYLIIFIGGSIGGIKKFAKINKFQRSSKKSVTIYYAPPKDIEFSDAAWFWYARSHPKIFTSLIYYRASKGRIKIEDKTKSYLWGLFITGKYHLIENAVKPIDTTPLEDELFQIMFGVYDEKCDNVKIGENTYKKVLNIEKSLKERMKNNPLFETQSFLKSLIGNHRTLTPHGEELFEKMRGYKEYLSKVERPVIESELKRDPDYINKILPWAVLFGVETKLLKDIQDLFEEASRSRYYSANGNMINMHIFNHMTNSFRNNSVEPSKSSGGFGGGGGSSGGGGGGGGGGSR